MSQKRYLWAACSGRMVTTNTCVYLVYERLARALSSGSALIREPNQGSLVYMANCVIHDEGAALCQFIMSIMRVLARSFSDTRHTVAVRQALRNRRLSARRQIRWMRGMGRGFQG